MSIHHTLEAASRFHDLRFCYFPIDASDPSQREYIFVACEDGKTRVFDITTSASTAKEVSEDDDEEDETPSIEAVAILSGHANRCVTSSHVFMRTIC
jgi:protein MAK11